MSKKSSPFNFEEKLNELEQLIKKMEQGELPLEDSLALYEKGVLLTRTCQTALQEAEQKVKTLTDKTTAGLLDDFPAEQDDLDN